MNVGSMNREIVIQKVTETDDPEGGTKEAWTDFATVFAEVRPQSGGERDAASQPQETQISTFRTHFDDAEGATEKMRINYDGLVWDILRIEEIGFKTFRLLTAEAGRVN